MLRRIVLLAVCLCARILKMAANGPVTTFREPANRPNGMVFDAQFRLITAAATA